MHYAEKHDDAYPTYHEFSVMIQSQARKRNHPYVSAGVAMSNSYGVNHLCEESKRKPPPKPDPETRRVLKTDTTPVSGGLPDPETGQELETNMTPKWWVPEIVSQSQIVRSAMYSSDTVITTRVLTPAVHSWIVLTLVVS